MTTCLGKCCSFAFPFGFEDRIWVLIVLVPDHCLSFYLSENFFYVATMFLRSTCNIMIS